MEKKDFEFSLLCIIRYAKVCAPTLKGMTVLTIYLNLITLKHLQYVTHRIICQSTLKLQFFRNFKRNFSKLFCESNLIGGIVFNPPEITENDYSCIFIVE